MLAPAIDLLRNHRDRFLAPDSTALFEFRADEYINAGMPDDLAHKVAGMILLVAAGDIASIATRIGSTVERVAQFYFRVSYRFGLGWLRAAADNLPDGGQWQRLAIDAVIDDLYVHQGLLTAAIIQASGSLEPEEALAVWSEQRRSSVQRVERLLGEMRTVGQVDLATLVVAGNHLRALAHAQTS
jgi:glutamate dehydrogenase